ncbi:hypothetical protein BDV06DRAFT_38815 [Aspergillus oleicola]
MESETPPEPLESPSDTNMTTVNTLPDEPSVIGLYGLPGSGKSHLLKQLHQELGKSDFQFFEGSEIIDFVTDGGLEAFKQFDESQQTLIRNLAIEHIKSICIQSRKAGIVTGHFMFWDDEKSEKPLKVCTKGDFNTYTHIVYVNTPVDELVKQREQDMDRRRSNVSPGHLKRWQDAEIEELRGLCRDNGMLFVTVYPNLKKKLVSLIRDFQRHDPCHNASVAELQLDKALSIDYDKLHTVLFFDADKTLGPDDTAKLFWEKLRKSKGRDDPLKALFGGPLGYSYAAFRQAMLLYEESADDGQFDAICEEVAAETILYTQMSALLHRVKENDHICAVIVTCGLRRVWEKIITKEGLSRVVKVVGGGRIADEVVVTPSVKESLVTRAQVHGLYTLAFGDSPLDLPMLIAAHEAVVVVGEEQNRSKSMDLELYSSIKNKGLQARQALLLNESSPPRIDIARLPVVDLTEESFIASIFQRHKSSGSLALHHATDSNAAKLLATPTRDNLCAGLALRKAHSKAGEWLALTYLTEIIGLEKSVMHDTHGNKTDKYLLLGEERTVIVPVMRGGEPMACGLNEAFPKARFVHAKEAEELKKEHLEGSITVIVVDWVINSGKTIVEFIQRVREIHDSIRIVVVAGVVQDQVVKGCSTLRRLARSIEFTVVALRLSENKYTGKGATDTGHRLFNTTHLD